jgi:nucleotide-binding universal stress UspA family protein
MAGKELRQKAAAGVRGSLGMSMFRTILLPFDGSDEARGIVPTVTQLATRLGGEVVVHRCLEHDEDDGTEAEALAEELREAGLDARAHVGHGRPAEAIVEAAANLEATVIAMSTHGRSGLTRWALGSVAERVVRTSAIPVLLSRGAAEQERVKTREFRHVLVPLDGTAEALQVVEPFVELFGSLGAHATLLHCVSDYQGKSAMEAGQQHLDEAVQAFEERGVKVTTALRRGHPATTIAQYGLYDASQEQPDLVAMATHARKGVPRMLLGSVTEKVTRTTVTPMLVVPPAPAQ